ncbi:MAG: cob(I)yrinic acid a,c-diamide adenosyltransferase [Luteibaculaceae bacterium]
MKIYTKTGDTGETSLISGKRVPKDNDRIEAYGSVDELNSWLGVLLTHQDCPEDTKEILIRAQNELFVIGSHLANEPGKNDFPLPAIDENGPQKLEFEIDRLNQALEPLKHFVLPGGSQGVSFAHVARTVCRRAERHVVKLSHVEPVEESIIVYLNRLSDFLFIWSRYVAKTTQVEEVKWIPNK